MMNLLFYITAAVAILSTVLVVTRLNAVHALLYLIVSLLAIALIFFLLGAPFVAALEVIIYAGAIMVLFIFVIMMLNLGHQAVQQENVLLNPRIWAGPSFIGLILLAELVLILANQGGALTQAGSIAPREVGIVLFQPYLLGVEISSMLLLAGLVGAYHLGRRYQPFELEKEED